MNIAKECVKVFYMSACIPVHIDMCVSAWKNIFKQIHIYIILKVGNSKTFSKAYIQLHMDF